MGKIDRHIEIVSSSVKSLSSMSKASRSAIQRTLAKYYTTVGITIVDDVADLEALVSKAPDLVFLGMKYIVRDPHEEGSGKIWLAEYLAERGIAATGSSSLAHRVELSKPLAKRCVLDEGLLTSPYVVAGHTLPLSEGLLPADYPLFVKPADRGGGLGVDADSIVYNFPQLKSKVESIARDFGSSSIIEKYLPGREFSVAVLRSESLAGYTAMPLELIVPEDNTGAKILGSNVKSANAEQIVEVTDTDTRRAVVGLALDAFRAIGGRDYGRIDIRMDEHGTPYFLEANLIPSLIDNYGSFPKACAMNMGIGYDAMLLRIVRLGMARAQMKSEMRRMLAGAPVEPALYYPPLTLA